MAARIRQARESLLATDSVSALPLSKTSNLRARLGYCVLAAPAIRLLVVLFVYRDLPDADKFYESFGWEMGWAARAMASGHGFSSPYFPWSGPTALEPPAIAPPT